MTIARCLTIAAMCAPLWCLEVAPAQNARRAARARLAPTPAGTVQLPFQMRDDQGNGWVLYPQGWMQSQGNQPTYSQAALLSVNGQQIESSQNLARRDAETGEIVLDLQVGPLNVTRRVLGDEAGVVRIVDVFESRVPARETTFDVRYMGQLNYGYAATRQVEDPSREDVALGMITVPHNAQGFRSAAEVFAGRGAKVLPSFSAQPNGNQLSTTFRLSLPAGKQVALLHLHSTAMNPEEAQAWAESLKPADLMRALPLELRKLVANFVSDLRLVGERELLRGDLLDVVELRGGDQLKGTLAEPRYELHTSYGPLTLPAERLVGLMSVGEFRPRQLLITSDGEVYGGTLAGDSLTLELSSGQKTQVPLARIARVGYRKRSDEPEEWTFDKPMVLLRTGDRMIIATPVQSLDVATRYGTLKLDPASVAMLATRSEEGGGVHQIQLTDGSVFAGLLLSPQLEFTLAGAAAASAEGQPTRLMVPVSEIDRVYMAARKAGRDVEAPAQAMLRLDNGDVLAATFQGEVKLDTAFDTLSINAAEIRALAPAEESSGQEVRITLWDQSQVGGRIQSPALRCALGSGLMLDVPVSMMRSYEQPRPQVSGGMLERIKLLVARLNADDWKERDRAQAELIAIGDGVIPVLQQLRPSQPPEAQQRMDQVLSALDGGATVDGRRESRAPAGAGRGLP